MCEHCDLSGCKYTFGLVAPLLPYIYCKFKRLIDQCLRPFLPSAMDGLSGAASVLSVVSLAIQLADGIKKLCDFCDSVQEAPEAVSSTVHELKKLYGILIHMQSNGDQYRPDVATTSVLEGCMVRVTEMMTLIKKFEEGLHSSSRRVRKWRGVQVVLQKDKIKTRLSVV